MEAEAPCSLCRAIHPGVSGLKLPLSPPWALCIRGREGLIWVHEYVEGLVQSMYHIRRSNCWMWYCSSFVTSDLDTVPPYKQILHIHSTHNKYSHQNCIIWTNFWTKMIFFFYWLPWVWHISKGWHQSAFSVGVEQILLCKKQCLSTRYRHTGGSPHMELSGQFTDKPTSSQSSQKLPNWSPCGLGNLRTGQFVD